MRPRFGNNPQKYSKQSNPFHMPLLKLRYIPIFKTNFNNHNCGKDHKKILNKCFLTICSQICSRKKCSGTVAIIPNEITNKTINVIRFQSQEEGPNNPIITATKTTIPSFFDNLSFFNLKNKTKVIPRWCQELIGLNPLFNQLYFFLLFGNLAIHLFLYFFRERFS